MADGIWRYEPAIEVHAFHLGIRRQDLQGAAHRLDCGGVVARADDDPLRRGEPRSDARDECVLTAIGYCERIQNEGAMRSPALPCGEVE